MAQLPPTRPRALGVVLRALPGTLGMVLVILIVGIASQSLWRPFESQPAWDAVAYGLPAFTEGRYWTAVIGAFFVSHPLVYLATVPSFAGMAYLEWKRGTRVALSYFWIGHLFAVFASALFLLLANLGPWTWPWARALADALDVGPSGGTIACIAAAVGLLTSMWRVRGWLILLSYLIVSVLFWGALADLEHLFGAVLIIVVDRSLRIHRASLREQRLIGFVGIIALGAIHVLTSVLPTSGPFGDTEPLDGTLWGTALDIALIVLMAAGLHRGRRWSWVLSLLLAAVNVLAAGLILLLLLLTDAATTAEALGANPAPDLASGVLWLLALCYFIATRRAFRVRRRTTIGSGAPVTSDEVRALLREHGGGTLSWMATWEGMDYVRAGGGVVAYQRRAGVALALADPIGPDRARAVTEFIGAAERSGAIPCFFSADEKTRALVPSGWKSLVVADDTIVDLPGLTFTGKAWGAVRTALNRAGREEMTFRLTRWGDEPWGIQQQLRAISESWVGDKSLPEMGFTLGSLDEAADGEVRLALAVSSRGDVDGFLSWLPVFGAGEIIGWTLDLMRRRDGGFGPVMEFLIGSSAAAFRDEGARVMSLSGAPLAHDYPADAGMIAQLSDKLAEALEPVYGFRSLHRFKEKFHPRYETLYLLYRDEADLARIGAALTRAYLPEATVRQFAGAGWELVRGRDD